LELFTGISGNYFWNVNPKQPVNLKTLNMKHLLFMVIIVGTLIISTLNCCNKSDSLPNQNQGINDPKPPMTLNLTTNRWEKKGDGIFVNTFTNVIPAGNANHLVKIYLVTDGKDALINQPIRFMDGALWATNTQTDIAITYRGSVENVRHLNIKVVIE
jgi:hypothetical protein